MAEEHRLDLSAISSDGRRIEKADVAAFLEKERKREPGNGRLIPASPKARRLAAEHGLELSTARGSGPDGAVLAADVMTVAPTPGPSQQRMGEGVESLGTVWRVMAERMTASWTSVPHFYLTRDVAASGLVELRARITPAVERRSGLKPTYTDLLVKLIAMALRDHPRLNASWAGSGIRRNGDINIGIATAIDEGLIVPVIHNADGLSISEIASKRGELVARASENKLRPADISGGTFTFSNLGMYNVDAFSAIVNPPQAAILAVGRVADRVVPVNGQPAVRPMMIVTLSCDHRVADGARAAKFLDDLSNLMEEPWRLLA